MEGGNKSSTQFVNVHSSDTHFGFNQITEISPQLQFLFSFFSDIEAQVKLINWSEWVKLDGGYCYYANFERLHNNAGQI